MGGRSRKTKMSVGCLGTSSEQVRPNRLADLARYGRLVVYASPCADDSQNTFGTVNVIKTKARHLLSTKTEVDQASRDGIVTTARRSPTIEGSRRWTSSLVRTLGSDASRRLA